MQKAHGARFFKRREYWGEHLHRMFTFNKSREVKGHVIHHFNPCLPKGVIVIHKLITRYIIG